uniref:Integrase catalytic domain-containing protein n=1 Tax=Vitis vinifera TaxID=29760 RepID=A5BLS3_VITVI|nr:hypothetical protein VITISV_014922 [Vitis vinifera]
MEKTFFERIRQFRLRLNPKKCTFRVTSGKLLGYMVSERGIEVDPDKIRAIFDMPAPRTEREVRGFLGRVSLLFEMISVSAHLRGSESTCCHLQSWSLLHQAALYFYTCQSQTWPWDVCWLNSMIRRMLDYETRYVMIEHYCLALVWVTRRLRHYITEYSVHLISRLDPLRYLFNRPALKSIRDSIVADHLASLPVSDGRVIDDDFPDEDVAAMTSLSGWCMYFDGAANHSRYRIGVLLISPHGDHIPRSVRLAFSNRHPMNNIVEYEACILELEASLKLGIRQMEVFGDSNLFVDALATLASMIDVPADATVRPLLIESRSAPTYCCLINDTKIDDGLTWYHDIYHFLRLGIDIIGKISSKSSNGHEFILVTINYFTKWVEATSYAILTSAGVASFIKSHIICCYEVSHELISNRGVHFKAEVDTLVQRYGIRHHRSSAYRPQMNGAVEAANKNIKRILQRMVEISRDWSEKLPFALWAYQTSFRTSTGATPYSLVYGMEAVLPISEVDWVQAQFDQLNLLDERRLRAADHVHAYQKKMARAFKKRVKPTPLQIGDLVLKVIRGLIRDPRGKFRPNWSGPYFIRELTPEGAAWLMDLDGNRFSKMTNVDQLKRYYV